MGKKRTKRHRVRADGDTEVVGLRRGDRGLVAGAGSGGGPRHGVAGAGGKESGGKSGGKGSGEKSGPIRPLPRQAPEASAGGQSVPGDWICCKCNFSNFRYRAKCLHCENPRKDGPPVKGGGKGGGKSDSKGKGKGEGKGTGFAGGEEASVKDQLAKALAEIAKLKQRPPGAAAASDDDEEDEMDVEGSPEETILEDLKREREQLKGIKRVYLDAHGLRFNGKAADTEAAVQNADDFVGGPYRAYTAKQRKVDELEAQYRDLRPLDHKEKVNKNRVAKLQEQSERNTSQMAECQKGVEELAAAGLKKAAELARLQELHRSLATDLAEAQARTAELAAIRKEQDSRAAEGTEGGGAPGAG